MEQVIASISIEAILGLVLIFASAGLALIFSLRPRRKVGVLRAIPALEMLTRAMGRTVESGGRLHIALGSRFSGATLGGLSALEQAARLSSISDRPPVVNSGDGSLALLSQDTLRAAYRKVNASEQYDPDRGRLSGVTPLAYTVGTLAAMRDEQVTTSLITGNFGPEAALLVDAANEKNHFTLTASDSLAAQAASYVSAEAPLIGEELYAIPAYLKASPAHVASLRVQDILRWLLALGLILAAVLRLLWGGLS